MLQIGQSVKIALEKGEKEYVHDEVLAHKIMQHLHGKLSIVAFPMKKEKSNVIIKTRNRLQMNSTNFFIAVGEKTANAAAKVALDNNL
jgi:hypothetical protein